MPIYNKWTSIMTHSDGARESRRNVQTLPCSVWFWENDCTNEMSGWLELNIWQYKTLTYIHNQCIWELHNLGNKLTAT